MLPKCSHPPGLKLPELCSEAAIIVGVTADKASACPQPYRSPISLVKASLCNEASLRNQLNLRPGTQTVTRHCLCVSNKQPRCILYAVFVRPQACQQLGTCSNRQIPSSQTQPSLFCQENWKIETFWHSPWSDLCEANAVSVVVVGSDPDRRPGCSGYSCLCSAFVLEKSSTSDSPAGFAVPCL